MRYRLNDPPFAGRSGRGVTIAILDSGLHAEHPHLTGAELGVGRSFAPETDDTIDRVGHGTAVAAAIHEKAPDAQLIPVKVFHRHLTTNAATLAEAIEWAAEAGAQLINLSLGTSNPVHRDRLDAAVRSAAARGAFVVGARATEGVSWYPGSLASAIGVIADPDCDRDEVDFHGGPEGPFYTEASIFPRPIPGVPRERNLAGISFAVANTTGFLARALEGRELGGALRQFWPGG